MKHQPAPARRTPRAKTVTRTIIAPAAVAVLLSAAALMPPPAAGAAPRKHAWKSCTASFDGATFTIGNDRYRRAWQLGDGTLLPIETGKDTPAPPASSSWKWSVAFSSGRDLPVEAAALTATLTAAGDGRTIRRVFRVFDTAPAVEWRRIEEPGADVPDDAVIDRVAVSDAAATRFTAVYLQDHTDRHGKKDNLVRIETRRLDNKPFDVKANIAFIEDEGGEGLLLVKLAPLPHARSVKTGRDFSWDGRVLRWHGPGINAVSGRGYRCATVAFRGGRPGRIAALQDYYRCLRRYRPGRDGLLLSNTWGDRSRDAKISEQFLLAEIRAGKALGVDVMEVDDGWQKGATKNSAVSRSTGGVWSGFWRADPHFWTPHPQRLPDGLAPVKAAAEKAGLRLGLWYAPDSDDQFANWKRDADRLLALHRDHGVDYFKLDSITMKTPRAELNVRRLLDRVIRESGGAIVTDLDVTAGVRPGYLGAVAAGTVFVENRYTDWGNYRPHWTLRNFWSLAAFVDPVRLRMEFLNNTRNQKKYTGELAPATYPPAYLFASVMLGSPLAWFEVSGLPDAFAEEVAALVAVWKEHRDRLHGGHIIPIGAVPDGHSWTGFASIARDRRTGYLLALREVNDKKEWRTAVPLVKDAAGTATVLAGEGTAALSGGAVAVTIPSPRGYLFVKMDFEK